MVGAAVVVVVTGLEVVAAGCLLEELPQPPAQSATHAAPSSRGRLISTGRYRQWAVAFRTTAATKHNRAPARTNPEARGPGRPVTMLAMATIMQSTAIRANTAASARTHL